MAGRRAAAGRGWAAAGRCGRAPRGCGRRRGGVGGRRGGFAPSPPLPEPGLRPGPRVRPSAACPHTPDGLNMQPRWGSLTPQEPASTL
ncbi:hypothetical protein BKD26_20900 [Streptomyces sp. CB03238]|nr:hypothetical protein BKD26_20900 [Streptomyces sp. CB03238]